MGCHGPEMSSGDHHCHSDGVGSAGVLHAVAKSRPQSGAMATVDAGSRLPPCVVATVDGCRRGVCRLQHHDEGCREFEGLLGADGGFGPDQGLGEEDEGHAGG